MNACACGQHHTHDLHSHTVPVGDQIALKGTLRCADTGQLMAMLLHVSSQVSATRAEPGCLHFDISQTGDPLVWRIEALFRDAAALEAHRVRTAASAWAGAMGGICREIRVFGS